MESLLLSVRYTISKCVDAREASISDSILPNTRIHPLRSYTFVQEIGQNPVRALLIHFAPLQSAS